MKKLVFGILIFLAIAGGCGAEKNNHSGAAISESPASQNMAIDPAKAVTGAADTASKVENSAVAPQGETYQRKVIQNRDILLQVDNVRETVSHVQEKVLAAGGFVSELNLSDNEQVSANLVLRIPVKGVDEFGKFLSGLGRIRSDNLRTEDITGTFYDAQARLDNCKVQEKRLLELLGQAKSMEDILKLEGEISKIREQIEVLQGQINRWNQQVDLATIRLVLQTKELAGSGGGWEPLGFSSALAGAKNGVLVTLKAIYHVISWCVVFLGYLAPILLIGGPVGYFVWRRKRNKSV